MAGATFTISSLGGIGGTSFTPIVNAPEVAILGVVRSAMKPVWDGKEFVPRLMLPLSLSYDHRVIDGAAAARFVAHLSGVLTDLRRVLLLSTLDVLVPDIGDFTDVPVAEILVAVGDAVAAEDPLVVLESDKSSMEIPAPEAGTVKELKVAVGDAVSEGSALVVLEVETAVPTATDGGGAPAEAVESPAEPAPDPSRDDSTAPTAAQSSLDAGGGGRWSVGMCMRAWWCWARAGRLCRGVPRRRPRPGRRDDRALPDPRWRLPQRRLHPVQGAAARREGHRRGRDSRRSRHLLQLGRRSISTRCAPGRRASSPSSPAG